MPDLTKIIFETKKAETLQKYTSYFCFKKKKHFLFETKIRSVFLSRSGFLKQKMFYIFCKGQVFVRSG
jgi:hypothetical protein